MKKIIISILLLAVLLFQVTLPVSASVFEAVTEDDFTVKFSCYDDDIDLSGIEIKVYSATLAFSEASNGYMQYNEEYVFSVYTNSQGSVIFDRPSDNFSITVDLSTLPEDYGIDNHTKFIGEDTKAHIATLSEIVSADVAIDNGEALPILRDANGNAVYADAQITDQSIRFDTDSKLSISTGNTLSYITEYNIAVYDKEYVITKEDCYEYSNNADKAGLMYGNGIITEHEYMNALSG